MEKKHPGKHGGPRPGSGRPPAPAPKRRSELVKVTVEPDVKIWLMSHGGASLIYQLVQDEYKRNLLVLDGACQETTDEEKTDEE